jgi:DNA-binding response OmpR family regulator
MTLQNPRNPFDADSPPRILVVDDDAFIRDLLIRHLSNQGFFVSAAANAEEAAGLLEHTPHDVGLIDIWLPDSNGIELIDRLKGIQSDIILILMTGQPSFDSVIEAMKRGVHDYLLKPFKLDHLSNVLERALDQRRILIENRRLGEELAAAKEKIRQYESLLGHPRLVRPPSDLEKASEQTRGDAAYRFQSFQSKESQLKDMLEKLDLLKAEGILNDEEYEIRRSQLLEGRG